MMRSSSASRLAELQRKSYEGTRLTEQEASELQALVANLLSVDERRRFDTERQALAALPSLLDRSVSRVDSRAAEGLALFALSSFREQPHQHLRVVTPAIRRSSQEPRIAAMRPSPFASRRLSWAALACAGLAALGGVGLLRLFPPFVVEQPNARAIAFAVASELSQSAASQPEASNREQTVPEVAAHVVLVSGAASINELPADTERGLVEGDVLSTTQGAACFVVEPKIEVCLGEHSTLQLDKLEAPNKEFKLQTGVVVARLAKQPSGHSFSIVTDSARATAVGTVFAVRSGQHSFPEPGARHEKNASADGVANVAVLEGTVAVNGTRRETKAVPLLVSERQTTRVVDGATDSVTRLSRKDESKFWSVLGAEAWASGERRGVLLFELQKDAPSGAQLFVDETGPWTPPVALSVPQGVHQWRLSGQARPSNTEVVAGDEVRVGLGAADDASKAEPSRSEHGKASNASAAPGELLKAARAALSSGELDAAIAIYGKLSALHPNSAEGRGALVTLGQLELQSARASKALRHFDAYLRRGGALAPEALAGKVSALQRLSSTKEMLAAMQRYVELYPRHPRASQYCKQLGSACPSQQK